MKVRNVNLGRNYQLEDDLFLGLKDAVNTTRPALALEYVRAILEEFETRLSSLENPTKAEPEIVEEPVKAETKKPTVKAPAKMETDAESDSAL